jgi:tetratricopeptide (TPR) repeat protein
MRNIRVSANTYIGTGGFALAVVLLFFTTAESQDVPFGARPTAMGDAFVAVADDGNAAFWNPAGLTLLPGFEMNTMYTDLYATGIRHSLLGLAFPFRNWGSFGLAWSRIGYDDFELTYGENQLLFSMARRLPYRLSIGLNAKHLRTDVEFEGVSYGHGDGWGLDLGLLYRPIHGFGLGLTIKDLGDTGVKYDTGHTATVLTQALMLGAAYRLTDKILLAGSLDDRLHWGGEYMLTDALTLRAGFQDDLTVSEPVSWSTGLGIRLKVVQFDYAYANVPTLPSTHRFSFGLKFEREEPWVRTEWVALHDLFAAQYKRYVNHPIGTVRVVNVSDKTMAVKAGIEFNGYTDGPIFSDETVLLKPEESVELPLTVVLNSNILNVTADGTVQGKVLLLYSDEEEGRERKSTTGQKANLYGRNAIRWDDVRKIAAFIEPKDESIRIITSHALKAAEEEVSFVVQDLLNAMAIFDVLGGYGLVYSPDPQTPYSSLSRQHEIVDHVQYPAETIAEGRGDCDDFVVLYASCLENVGVPTAILDVPGHLLIAVAIDQEDVDGAILGFEPNAFLRHNDRLWVPVETTLFGSSFNQAWQEGVKMVEQWRDMLRIIEIEEAWQAYPSNEIHFTTQKGRADVKETDLFRQDLRLIRNQKYEHIVREHGYSDKSDSTDITACNEIGVRLGQAGLLDEAIDFLRRASLLDSTSSQSLSNLGVVYSRKGLHQEALSAFRTALALTPDDADIHLNLAFLYYEMGDLDQARAAYEKAITLNPEFEGQFEFLKKKSDVQKQDRIGRLYRGNFIWK